MLPLYGLCSHNLSITVRVKPLLTEGPRFSWSYLSGWFYLTNWCHLARYCGVGGVMEASEEWVAVSWEFICINSPGGAPERGTTLSVYMAKFSSQNYALLVERTRLSGLANEESTSRLDAPQIRTHTQDAHRRTWTRWCTREPVQTIMNTGERAHVTVHGNTYIRAYTWVHVYKWL